jgi:hypothetical protein
LTHEGKSGGILRGEYGWIVSVTMPSDPLPADLAAAHARKRPRQAIDLVNHDEVNPAELNLLEQLLQSRAIQVAARIAGSS